MIPRLHQFLLLSSHTPIPPRLDPSTSSSSSVCMSSLQVQDLARIFPSPPCYCPQLSRRDSTTSWITTTSSYDCHVLTKELDCEDIRLAIDSELLLGNPTRTLVNKHASHVWSKIMELLWTPSAPPIFALFNSTTVFNYHF